MPNPLPKYAPISVENIPPASALLFYGGNKLTEWVGNKWYKHPYKPPAFHAAFYMDDGLFLNVGKFRTVQELKAEFRSTRRVDVIIYSGITDEARERMCRRAQLDVSKPKIGVSLPDYDWLGYLRFGLKFLKPSKRKDFCSENAVELFATENVTISHKPAYSSAPWHLYEYALSNPGSCDLRTVWTGPEFKG